MISEFYQEEKKLNHKNIHQKICKMNFERSESRLEYSPLKADATKTSSSIVPSFHKKTASMDMESKKNLNINLSINNYAVYPGKKKEGRKVETISERKKR